MAKGEVKCNSLTETFTEKKRTPQTPSSSIWSCITGVSRWTDIIKQAGREKNDSTKDNKFTPGNLKEKKKSTKSIKETPLPNPKTCENPKISDSNEIRCVAINKLNQKADPHPDKNTIEVFSEKMIEYNKPTTTTTEYNTTIKRQVYKSGSQEVNVKLNNEKRNFQWIQNISVQEFYRVEEELIRDKKKKCEHNRPSKAIPTGIHDIRDEKTRIIVLLLQKIKKLELQMRDLQFINSKKKNLQEKNNKKTVKEIPLISYKINETKNPELNKDGKNQSLNLLRLKENINVPLGYTKTPVTSPEKLRAFKLEAQNKDTENSKSKRKRRILKNTIRNEFTSKGNHIKGVHITENNDGVISQTNTKNVDSQNHKKTTSKERTTLWLLFNRIRNLESQIKSLDKSANNHTRNPNYSNINPLKVNPLNEKRQDFNKTKNKKLLNINVVQGKQENYNKHSTYELYLPSKIKKRDISKTNGNTEGQGNRLATIDSFNKRSNCLIDIVQKLTSEKITQTSKQYFTSLSKTEITGDNNHKMSSTSEVETDNEIPTKDEKNKNSSTQSQLSHKSVTESDQDEKVIRIKKAGYSFTTISTQKSENYDTNEDTIGGIYDSEMTDNTICKTTTTTTTPEDEENYSENTWRSKGHDQVKDKNEPLFGIAHCNKKSKDNNDDDNDNDDDDDNNDQKIFNLFVKKRYISAKERQKIDEEFRKQQKKIYADLITRNNGFNILKNMNNNFLNKQVTPMLQKPIKSMSSSAVSGDVVINSQAEYSVTATLKTSKSVLPSYYNHVGNNISYSPFLITKQQTCDDSLKANINLAAKSEIVCPIIRDFSLTNCCKDQHINRKMKWKSLTSIPAISNEFIQELHEIKNNKIEPNCKIVKKNFEDRIIKTVESEENVSDILMNVIQLSQPQTPIPNVSNAYIVLVNDETNHFQKIVNEDRIREIIGNLSSSIENVITKESQKKINKNQNSRSKVIKSKAVGEMKTEKCGINKIEKPRTNKNNKSDTQVLIKSNKNAKINNKSDSHMIRKRAGSPKTTDEENSEELIVSEKNSTISNKALITKKSNSEKIKRKTISFSEMDKCQCLITGTNVCFPPLNYIDYNLSTSNISTTETDKSLSESNKQKSKKVNIKKELIIRLQKEIELQRKEVHELKNIWSKCSARLDDIWRNKQNNELGGSNSSNEKSTTHYNLIDVNPYPMGNHIKNKDEERNEAFLRSTMNRNINDPCVIDENKLHKTNIICAFESLAESSLILSGILSEAKGSQQKFSLTEITSNDFLNDQYPLEGDGSIVNIRRANKISDLNNHLTLDFFQKDELTKRNSNPFMSNSQKSSIESYTNTSSFYSDDSSSGKISSSDKSTQTHRYKSRRKTDNSTNGLTRIQKRPKNHKTRCISESPHSNINIEKILMGTIKKNNKIQVKE